MDEKARLLYFLAALGALCFALMAALNEGFLRVVFAVPAMLCVAKAFALKPDRVDPAQPSHGAGDATSETDHIQARPTTSDRVFRGIGRLVLG